MVRTHLRTCKCNYGNGQCSDRSRLQSFMVVDVLSLFYVLFLDTYNVGFHTDPRCLFSSVYISPSDVQAHAQLKLPSKDQKRSNEDGYSHFRNSGLIP
jgi:hypothetical protein